MRRVRAVGREAARDPGLGAAGEPVLSAPPPPARGAPGHTLRDVAAPREPMGVGSRLPWTPTGSRQGGCLWGTALAPPGLHTGAFLFLSRPFAQPWAVSSGRGTRFPASPGVPGVGTRPVAPARCRESGAGRSSRKGGRRLSLPRPVQLTEPRRPCCDRASAVSSSAAVDWGPRFPPSSLALLVARAPRASRAAGAGRGALERAPFTRGVRAPSEIVHLRTVF